jgi:hypothetical protein
VKETHIVYVPGRDTSPIAALNTAKELVKKVHMPVEFRYKDALRDDFYVVRPRIEITKNGAKLGVKNHGKV